MNNDLSKAVELLPHADSRGKLYAIEGENDIPFEIKRVFFISDVPPGAKRGCHAYKHNEFAVCVSGSCKVNIDYGNKTEDYELNAPEKGLLIPAMTRRTLYDFSPDCVLTVLSDAHFSTDDYIDETEFHLQINS